MNTTGQAGLACNLTFMHIAPSTANDNKNRMCTHEHSTLYKLTQILQQLHSLPVWQVIQVHCHGLPVSIRQCTKVSGRQLSLIADIRMRQLHSTDTAIRALVSYTTPSAIAVLQRLDHARGTQYLLNYDNVSLREFKRLLKTHLFGQTGT